MVKVVLADDEEYVKCFLRIVMDSLSFEVVAEVERGDELPEVMEQTQPDMLLLDINMPNLTGIEFLKKYAAKFPQTCIIVLTSISLMDLIGEDSLSGASCFLRKGTPVEEMTKAIDQAWVEFKNQHQNLLINR